MEKKKTTRKTRRSKIKDGALSVGHGFEKLFIRKNDGEDNQQGIDLSMNSANFAIFQGAGLETFDSRGLGRQWSRRDDSDD